MKTVFLFVGTFEKAKLASVELEEYFPSLGVLSLATNLDLHGYQVKVIDFTINALSIEDLSKMISEYDPMLIGYSAYTENVDACLKQAKYIKKLFPMVKILFGGPHPTLDPKYCIKNRFVDFVLVNEGDASIVELCEAISSNQKVIKYCDIENLLYREDGEIVKNDSRKPITDIDLNPIISRKYIGYEKLRKWATIYTSRGCPGKCIYCAASALSGATYRVRDIESVYFETLFLRHKMNMLNEPKMIYYIDDTFTALPSRIKKFIELVKKYKVAFEWRCESRIDVMNQGLLNDLSSIGCKKIQYGMESGSQYVLDNIQKRMDLEKALQIIRFTHEAGIKVVTSFMFGHFCDTKETMQETLDLIQFLTNNYSGIEIFVSYNTPFPGTYQYDQLNQLGMKLCVNNYSELTLNYPVVETTEFTKFDQTEFYIQAYALMNIEK